VKTPPLCSHLPRDGERSQSANKNVRVCTFEQFRFLAGVNLSTQEAYMMDRMISDLALDLGAFELDNELETGLELSQRLQTQLACRQFRAFEFHQEALCAAKLERQPLGAIQVGELVLN
jgi:hypothetical protein